MRAVRVHERDVIEASRRLSVDDGTTGVAEGTGVSDDRSNAAACTPDSVEKAARLRLNERVKSCVSMASRSEFGGHELAGTDGSVCLRNS